MLFMVLLVNANFCAFGSNPVHESKLGEDGASSAEATRAFGTYIRRQGWS